MTTQRFVGIGFAPDDRNGDALRTSFDKINQNFTDLFNQRLGGIAPGVFYVAKNGSDINNGDALGNAFLTVKRAVQVATAYLQNNPGGNACIFVKSGDYTEENPVVLPPRLTIWGDNLRSVSVRPANPTQDIFHVQNANYITGITFRDHVSPAAAIAFPSGGAGFITTSPYIQNCSSITTTGAGMRIDGNLAGGLKSMVTDSYTQINEGGIGIHILNQGYAQLVSIFTICCQEGILCENGGLCSITNSNTSFGTFGLVARGKVEVANTALVDGPDQIGRNIVLKGLSEPLNTTQAISFDGGNTLFSILNFVDLGAGRAIVTLGVDITTAFPNETAVSVYIPSVINASAHTFEFVGTGNQLVNALPQLGAIPVQENEIVQEDGGTVIYTSTDHRGDFRIGDELTINGIAGTITGDTFNKALFAVLTPYILAIEG